MLFNENITIEHLPYIISPLHEIHKNQNIAFYAQTAKTLIIKLSFQVMTTFQYFWHSYVGQRRGEIVNNFKKGIMKKVLWFNQT